jgi:tetratricopeptide (TPR) repeat protein
MLRLESKWNGDSAIPAGMKTEDLNAAASNALEHNNPREAAKLLEKVVELDPKYQDAWTRLGQAYLQLHQFDKAESALRKQIDINPYDEYAYNSLGFTLERKEDYEGAITAYKKQIEINPLDQYAHASLGGLFLRRTRYSEAAPELETAVGILPKNAYLQAQLGTAYLNLNEHEKSQAAYDKAIELAPVPLIWNEIAYELSEKDVQLDRARSYAESAVSATSANLRNLDIEHLQLGDLGNTASIAAYWDTLGWIYYKQGDNANALKYIAAAWSLAQHSDIASHLARVYEKLGNTAEAKRYYALSVVAFTPAPDAHDRAFKAFGSEKALDAALPKAKTEIQAQRTFQIVNPAKANAKADFFVVFANDGKVAGAEYINGDDALKAFGSQFAQSNISTVMPQGSVAKVIRRGSLSCTAGKDCTFVLQPMEEMTSLD